MPPNTPDTDRLRRLYVDEQMTISEIAASLGVSPQTVHNWLVKAQIPRRPSPATPRTDIANSEIRRLYVNRRWSAPKIASHLGCATNTIYVRLDRLGIARRSERPRRANRPSDDDLRELYVTEQLRLRQIAKQLGVTAQTVHNWMTVAGIERQPPGSTAPTLDTDELAEQYLAGRSGLELADHYQVSPATIYRRLAHAGVDRRRPSPVVNRATLLAALAEGLSAPDIAAQLDVSTTAVCRALKREQLQTSTQAARQRSARHLAALHDALKQARADR